MTKKIHLRLLRHGNIYTGGDRFEDCLFDWLNNCLASKSIQVIADRRIAARIFRGWQNIGLFLWGIFSAKGDVIILPGRLALSGIIRSFFFRSKVICVLHYFDKRDGKSWFLRFYYSLLFSILRRWPPERFCIVVVSPFFHKLFKRFLPGVAIYLVPNLFQTDSYTKYLQPRNPKKILLGQVSFKNDMGEIEKLAGALNKKDFKCFFLTMRSEEVAVKPDYEINMVPFNEYLMEMATSYCSLAFTRINEGWSRMAHESVLVGAPVLGFNNGGLGDLLKESNSYIVKNADEACQLILSGQLKCDPGEHFIAKYDQERGLEYVSALAEFCLCGVKKGAKVSQF